MTGVPTGAVPRVRVARAGDERAIVALIRDGFDVCVRERIIYGCPGAESWVAERLGPAAGGDRAFTVADAGDSVVGVVDLQRADEVAFLSYVATDPRARGQGIAARLLAAALDRAAEEGARAFALDVFAHNAVARAWYARLGMVAEGQSVWIELAPRATRRRPTHLVVADRDAADAHHRRYGFSQLRVRSARGEYAVGRLGERWFRLTSPDALRDAELLDGLVDLDPRRSVFAIVPRGAAAADAGRPILESHRLTASLDVVRARLTSHRAPTSGAPSVA